MRLRTALTLVMLLAPVGAFAGTSSTRSTLDTQNNTTVYQNPNGTIIPTALYGMLTNIIASMQTLLDVPASGAVTGKFTAAEFGVTGTKPTATGAGDTCAAGAVAGGASAGTVTLTAACAATDTVALTAMPAATAGYSCQASDRTQPATLVYETSTTTTSATFTVSGTTSGATDVIQYFCMSY